MRKRLSVELLWGLARGAALPLSAPVGVVLTPRTPWDPRDMFRPAAAALIVVGGTSTMGMGSGMPRW